MPDYTDLIKDLEDNKFDGVEAALQSGLGLNDKLGEKGCTLLHYAARSANPALIDDLVVRGANVNAKDNLGRTPLHMVPAREGKKGTPDQSEPAVMELLQHGAQINAKDNRGFTPLDTAIVSRRNAVEKVLQDHGAQERPLKLNGAPLILGQGSPGYSAPELLAAATILNSEDVRHQQEVLKVFKDLYKVESFRPILDAAALRTLGPDGDGSRTISDDPRVVPPLRIVVDVNEADPNKLTGGGGYAGNDPAGILSFGLDHTKAVGGVRTREETLGSVIHELTHNSADHLFNNDAKPFPVGTVEGDQAWTNYMDPVMEDFRATHMNERGSNAMTDHGLSTQEKGLMYTMSVDKNHAQEYIVGVPQSDWLYGQTGVEDGGPSILEQEFPQRVAFFRQTYLPQVEAKVQQLMNDEDLAATLNRDKEGPAERREVKAANLSVPRVTAEQMTKLVNAELEFQQGNRESFGISTNRALRNAISSETAGLQSQLEQLDLSLERMPPELPSRELRQKMREMAAIYKDGPHGIKAADPQAVAAQFDAWVGEKREAYIGRQLQECAGDLTPKQEEFARVFLDELTKKQGDLAVMSNPSAVRALIQQHGPQIANLQPGDKGVGRLAAESAVKVSNHIKAGKLDPAKLTMDNVLEGSRLGKGTFHLREPRLETVDGAKNWTARGALGQDKPEKYGAVNTATGSPRVDIEAQLPVAPPPARQAAPAAHQSVGQSSHLQHVGGQAPGGPAVEGNSVGAKIAKRTPIKTSSTSSSLRGGG